MKIILFQFYSPNPCPDYDEMGGYFTRKGHDVFITHMTRDKKLRLCNRGGETDLDIFPWLVKNFRYFKFFARRIAFIIFMIRIRRLIKKMNPDIFMIATSELMYLSLLPILMPKRIKFIYDVRQLGFTPGNSFIVKLKNIKAKNSMRVLSQYIYDHTCFAFVNAAEIVLGDNWGNKKASVMEVGVNKLFLETPRNNRKMKSEKLQFVYIGSLAKVRKLEFIIDSFGQLTERAKKIHLTLIGPDSENYYHNYVIKNHLQDFVSLHDPVPYTDIPILLKNYDIGIAYVPEHPDWHYQPTLKVKEYCAVGIPILATDNLPNRFYVKENETGLFFNNLQENFCKVILRLIDDEVFFNELVNNALENRKILTWDDSAKSYEELFEKLIIKA